MLNAILIGVGVLILLVLVLAALKPNTFQVQRTRRIDAPPDRVYPLIEDFRRWPEWSPWENLDPTMTRTYSGAERGEGAVYEWDGNNKAGAGRMEILEAVPHSKVGIQLDFLRPMKSRSETAFALEPKVGGTEVTWSMQGPNPYVFRLMQTFSSVDKMIGKSYDEGLDKMKAVAESHRAEH